MICPRSFFAALVCASFLALARNVHAQIEAPTPAQQAAPPPAPPAPPTPPAPTPSDKKVPLPLLTKSGTITLPGVTGRGDSLTVFEGRLYVANTETGTLSVVDLKTNAVVATIANLPQCHGFAGIPGKDKGFVTIGGENKVGVIDLKTDTLQAKIDAGAGPDAILYAQKANLIYVACHDGGAATLIDPKRDRVVGTIPLGGATASAREDPTTGLIYQNVTDTSEVILVDPQKKSVKQRYTLGDAKSPTGLAFDDTRGVLFVAGSASEKLAITSAVPGESAGYLPLGANADAVDFDPELKQVYAANGAGSVTIVKETGTADFEIAGTVPIEPGTHTLTVDTTTHQLYALNQGVVTIYTPILTFGAKYAPPETPDLPKSLRSASFSAVVKVRVVLHADGTTEATVIQKSGYPALDEAALQACRKIKFAPASSNGKPADDTRLLTFHFNQN